MLKSVSIPLSLSLSHIHTHIIFTKNNKKKSLEGSIINVYIDGLQMAGPWMVFIFLTFSIFPNLFMTLNYFNRENRTQPKHIFKNRECGGPGPSTLSSRS